MAPWMLLLQLLAPGASAHADPPTPPPARDELNLRRDKWLTDELARHNTEGGRVDPAWRKVARDAQDAFHPDPRIVSQIDSATLWLRQVTKFLGKNGIAGSQQL